MEAFQMERATIEITYDCTLKCRLCSNYSPYVPLDLRRYPLQVCTKAIDKFFQIITYVGIFTISGGEPLLHPNLFELLEHLQNYSLNIGEVQVVTNGTLVPSQKILEPLKQWGQKAFLIVDNYGAELSTKIKEIDMLLANENIRHTIRNYTISDPHCGEWVAFGPLTKQTHRHTIRNYTISDPHCGEWVDFGPLTKQTQRSLELAEKLFAKCSVAQNLHFCFPIMGSEMWPCAPAKRRAQLGFEADPSEYIDLFDDSLTIEEQREKIRAIYMKKSLSACAYCTGLCEDSVRVVPGEQLTSEEMKYVRAGATCYADVLQMMQTTRNSGSKIEFEEE